MIYYGREYEEENKSKKEPGNRLKPQTMAVRSTLKQSEKNAQKDPAKKGWTCYYCGREGHLKQDCPQASKLPPAPCPVCKDHTGEKTALRGVGPRARTLKTIGTEGTRGPHTNFHANYT